MSDRSKEILELKQRQEAARIRLAKAEAGLESSRNQLEILRDRLKNEFGVETVEEAKALLNKLIQEVDSEIMQLDLALTEIEGKA